MSSEQHLECPVCLEPFTSIDRVPKALSCIHSVCLPCASTLIQNNQIRCPICRHREPVTGANELFTHHVLLAMAQEHEEEEKGQSQRAIKDDLEKAFDRIIQYKSTFGRKIALMDESNTELRKSAAQAKRETKAKFESCIKMLQDRMNHLLGEIEGEGKSFWEHVKNAQANFDKVVQLQHDCENLLDKEHITIEEYDNFKRSEALLKALSEKDDHQCQEITVSFEQLPNIDKVIKKCGKVQAPKPTAGVPLDFTQLSHTRTIGNCGSSQDQLNNPHGVAVTPTGTLVVADWGQHRIQELDADGDIVRVIGAEDSQDGRFTFPIDVAVDASGKIYVADQFNHRIQIFSREGNYLTQFGQEGSGPGEFEYPTGLAIDDRQGLLYVIDKKKPRIQVFDLEGNHTGEIGNDTELKQPCNICLHDDRLYVSDYESDHIVVYSANGNKLHVIGKHGRGPGEFDYPAGITIDRYGRIFVCVLRNNRIQILDGETGHVIGVFGSEGSGIGQYNKPGGVALTPSGQLVVTEIGGHRLQIFDFE